MVDDQDGLRTLEDRIGEFSRQRLAFIREEARRKQPGENSPILWVHLIHGTWANPAKARSRPTWFEPSGSLEAALRAHGDANDWRHICFAAAPHWSGENSFAARSAAAVQLSEYFEGVLFDHRTTFDRHVVIAHSHGGTVAVEALRKLGPLASEFSGLLTLGTPFVERFRKAERTEEVSFDGLTGVHAHAVAFFFAFTLALCLLFEGRHGLAAAGAVLALLPWTFARIPRLRFVAELLNSTIPLAALVAFLVGFDLWGPSGSLGTLIASAVVSLSFAVFLAPRLMVLRSVHFLGSSDGLREDELPAPLRTELLAIRAPSDEASLAISAASAAVWASDSLSSVGFKTLGRIPSAAFAVLGATLIATLVGSIVFPNNAAWKLAGSLTWSLPVIVPMALLILALLVKSTATLLIALACGPEALQAPGVMKIFAEPLPRSRDGLGAPATLRMVFPSSADLDDLRLKGSLRHAIYDYPSVQQYVAEWILRHAASPRSPD